MIERILYWLAVGAIAAAVIGGIVWSYEQWRDSVFQEGDTAGAARKQAEWDEDRATAQAAALEAARAVSRDAERVLKRQQENQRAQDQLLAQVQRDRDASAAAAVRMQQRAAAYLDAAGCGALQGDSAIECVRKAAAQVVDVLGRCATRYRQLADSADDARARGLKCETDYDALKGEPDAESQ